ncbi:MAG: type IV toxin-antitoxin system AbiEi family antitoxin domain-containing protein [Myxococcota bacterium]
MHVDAVASNTEDTSWGALYRLAEAQEGHFSAQQAAQLGYYPQRLQKHLKAGRVARIRRGIYRLTHFPHGEYEELVVYWLWAEGKGTYSGETALNLHGLSDALPSKLHLTLPAEWKTRRLRVPKGVVLYFADVDDNDRTWIGAVPVTTPVRTIQDSIQQHVQPDLVEQAIMDARQRGFITPKVASRLTKCMEEHR